MFKVVLVDDEPLVIEGLQAMIRWEELGFKICGTAYDGESAYELIKESNPDLVITDVRMPGMDGLALMKKCQSLSAFSARFIILSGYSDFNYVKEAIGLKGMSYVLKPIDPDEIEPILERFVEERNAIEIETQRKLAQIDFILRTSLVRILRGEKKESLFHRVQFILDVKEDTYFRIFQVDGFKNSLSEIVTETERYTMSYLDVMDGKETYLLYGKEMKQEEVKEVFAQWKEQRKERNLRIYCSYEVRNLSDLESAFHSLERAKIEAFYSCESVLISEESLVQEVYTKDCVEKDCLKQLFELSVLEQFSQMTDEENREKEIALWIQKVRSKKIQKDKLCHYYEVMVAMWLHEKGLQKELESLRDYAYFNDWKQHVIKDLKSFFDQPKKEPELIDKVKQYLELHYMQDLKLKTIAKEFGFNVIYFGQWFFKATEMKYNDYLLALRLEKAKELLRYTGMQIKEVSATIGFSNPDYFVLKFKEHEGMSPLQYRNRGGEKEK